MITRNYSLTEENRKEYAGIYVLEFMINEPKAFDVFLTKNDEDLEPILMWLLVKKYVEMKDDAKYVPSAKGRECLVRFLARYSEYLTMHDVFCAVDLTVGELAFAKYFDFEDKGEWRVYLGESRWEDLRIAVADFKGLDPIEIVFMNFIAEGRFGRDHTGWQFDLLLGSVWDDILNICNTALHSENLDYEDDKGEVSGKDVLKDVIVQGTNLMLQLLEQEQNMATPIDHHSNDSADDDEPEYVERVEYIHNPPTYYEPYRDPFYVSPIWRA